MATSPEEKRTKGRRKKLQEIWNSAEWKEQKKAFLEDYPNCEMHLKVIINGEPMIVPATVPHHPTRESYKGHYSNLELSQCASYCNRCHFAVHHGLRLCEKCGEHYHPWDSPECRYCFDKEHPEIVKAREEYVAQRERKEKARKDAENAKLRAAKQKHPCKNRRLSGACGNSKIGSRCPYAASKAEDMCGDFEPKKGGKYDRDTIYK